LSPHNSFHSIAFLICFAGVLLGGCSMRRRPGIPWATAIQVRPVILPQTATATATEIPEDPVPELRLEFPILPSHLMTMRSAPARPRVPPASSSAGAGAEIEKPESSLITPQLSTEETVVAQQQTNRSLRIAEMNLQSARGKRLNAAQLDLVSKIRGFLKDAHEAAQVADWARARSLSKKAQVLSEELVTSL
jgi:hypothetical protein